MWSYFSCSFNALQTAQGKTLNSPRVDAGFIKRRPIADGRLKVTCPLASLTSHLISDSCSSPRDFSLGLLQTLPHDNALALWLCEYLISGLSPNELSAMPGTHASKTGLGEVADFLRFLQKSDNLPKSERFDSLANYSKSYFWSIPRFDNR